jgi:predicted  nucleic acid-binding Zn-ribbon protein
MKKPVPHLDSIFVDEHRVVFSGEKVLEHFLVLENGEFLPITTLATPSNGWTSLVDAPFKINNAREVRWNDDHKEAQTFVFIDGERYNTYMLWFEAFKTEDNWLPTASYPMYITNPYGLTRHVTRKAPIQRYFLMATNRVTTRHDYDHGPLPVGVALSNEGFVIRKINGAFSRLGVFSQPYINRKPAAIDVQLLIEQAFIPIEHRNYYTEARYLAASFPRLKFNKMFEVPPDDRQNLLCIDNPEILRSYSGSCEDISDVTRLSCKNLDFLCYLHGKPYTDSPSRIIAGCRGCSGCKANPEQLVGIGHQSIQTGFGTEEYVCSFLDQCGRFEDVCWQANEDHGKDDARIRKDGRWHCLQIKTMRCQAMGGYKCTIENTYDDNMLMILANKDDSKFVVCYYSDVKHLASGLSVYFGSKKAGKYDHLKCESEEEACAKVHALVKGSVIDTDVTERYSANTRLERESKDRFFFAVKALGFTVDAKDRLAVDCAVNSKTIQMKFTQRLSSTGKYAVNLMRTTRHLAYSEDDGVDFFVFEIGAYKGQFLSTMGYISTPTQDGRRSITIPSPNYPSDDPLKIFWNKFDLLT